MKKSNLLAIIAVIAIVVIAIFIFTNSSTIYTVSFDTDGGTAIANQEVEEGKLAQKPTDPTKTGYTFKGWYEGTELFDFSKTLTKDVTLKAKWEAISTGDSEKLEKEYSISVVVDGTTKTVKTDKDGKIEAPTTPTKSGYKFLGWYVGDEKVDFTKPFTSNVTIEAKWEKVEETSTKPNEQKPEDEKPKEETPTVVKYTVKFDSKGGSAVSSQNIEKGKVATQPTDPTRTSYKFLGWYLGNTPYDFSTKVTESITLTAKWEEVKKVGYLVENVENSVANQVRIFVTYGTDRVAGTIDLTSVSGKVATIDVPATGYVTVRGTYTSITNVKVK